MNDNQRVLELKKCANKLNIRIHLASMNFDKDAFEPTKARDVFGIVFIDDISTNETAFRVQQHRYDGNGSIK